MRARAARRRRARGPVPRGITARRASSSRVPRARTAPASPTPSPSRASRACTSRSTARARVTSVRWEPSVPASRESSRSRVLPATCATRRACRSQQEVSPGHYCLQNTLTPDPLSALDIGRCSARRPSRSTETQFRPLPCLPATYCMEGVENNVTNEGVFTQPQPCKEGSYCEWGTSDKTFVVAGDVSSRCAVPAGELLPEGHVHPHPRAERQLRPRRRQHRGDDVSPRAVHALRGVPDVSGVPRGLRVRGGRHVQAHGVSVRHRPLAARLHHVQELPHGHVVPVPGRHGRVAVHPLQPRRACALRRAPRTTSRSATPSSQVANEFIFACEARAGLVRARWSCSPSAGASLCPEGYVCDARTDRRGR